MIYLDYGATSLEKPPGVYRAVLAAMQNGGNPGRGGYDAAMEAARTVYICRERAAELFSCRPEQVVFTANCTHALNIAIRSLIKPGARVVISGFEHNSVTRALHLLGAQVTVAGRRLFDRADTLQRWEDALRQGQSAAVFTHVSNVFGYILPVAEMAALCCRYGVPFVVDAAQSAGALEVNFSDWKADFVAMPGHKGLLGPQGTGLLLCAQPGEPLMAGGTGSESRDQQMPQQLPERLEAGTLNVPGIAGLAAGMEFVGRMGLDTIAARERWAVGEAVKILQRRGYTVFSGPDQAGVLSYLPAGDCEEAAQMLARRAIAVRAGLHCAPLAHESAGTLETGTVRLSFGYNVKRAHLRALERALM